jgi:ribosomal subunit interface protein
MNINIKTTGISLTPSISDYVEKRLRPIEKLLQDDSTVQCDVELAKTTNHHRHGDIFKAEVHIVGKDMDIFATVEKEDMYAAIDLVQEEVIRQIKSRKEKRQSLIRRGGAQVKEIIKGLWKNKKV